MKGTGTPISGNSRHAVEGEGVRAHDEKAHILSDERCQQIAKIGDHEASGWSCSVATTTGMVARV